MSRNACVLPCTSLLADRLSLKQRKPLVRAKVAGAPSRSLASASSTSTSDTYCSRVAQLSVRFLSTLSRRFLCPSRILAFPDKSEFESCHLFSHHPACCSGPCFPSMLTTASSHVPSKDIWQVQYHFRDCHPTHRHVPKPRAILLPTTFLQSNRMCASPPLQGYAQRSCWRQNSFFPLACSRGLEEVVAYMHIAWEKFLDIRDQASPTGRDPRGRRHLALPA